jgi:hypothetical protein
MTFLEYKLKDQGKRFLKIDKWFPSSKMCSECGRVVDTISLSERILLASVGSSLIGIGMSEPKILFLWNPYNSPRLIRYTYERN